MWELTGKEEIDVMWLRDRYRYDKHGHPDVVESEEMEVEGESGRECIGGKVGGAGNGIGMAVALDMAEKSGQGEDDAGTPRFGCFRRSGLQVWSWSS